MSPGICWRPARNSIIGSPIDHQMVVMASAQSDQVGWLRNGIGSAPIACAVSPSSPASGASTNRQMSVTMVTDSTEEEKKMPRNTAAPRVARLRASASASASTVSRGTIISASAKVLITERTKVSSASRRA
jgi:hypothetical protein